MKLSKSQFEEVLHFCCRSAALLLQKCSYSSALAICQLRLKTHIFNRAYTGI